jgi:hypothetical protein
MRHCATNRKVSGSFPDAVIENFNCYNRSGRTMFLRLTRSPTEMTTRNICWGKGGWCVELTMLPPSYADCLEIWDHQNPGTVIAVIRLYRDCFTFISPMRSYSFRAVVLTIGHMVSEMATPSFQLATVSLEWATKT